MCGSIVLPPRPLANRSRALSPAIALLCDTKTTTIAFHNRANSHRNTLTVTVINTIWHEGEFNMDWKADLWSADKNHKNIKTKLRSQCTVLYARSEYNSARAVQRTTEKRVCNCYKFGWLDILHDDSHRYSTHSTSSSFEHWLTTHCNAWYTHAIKWRH